MTRPDTYRQTRAEINSRPEIVPTVSLYKLGDPQQKQAFFNSLKLLPDKLKLVPWESTDDNEILVEALKRGIVVDQMPLQLADLITTRKPAGSLVGKEAAVARYAQMYSLPQNGIFVEFNHKTGNGRYVHLLDPDDFYELAFSRNQFAISLETQAIIRKNHYAVAGASVGGMVAWLMMMSGAENISVADGGPLKLHSFGRLVFASLEDLGKNKAYVFGKHALEFNPFLNLELTAENLTDKKQMKDFVAGAAVLVEAVDGLQNKADIQESGLDASSVVYAPTDLGLGDALLQIITPETGPFMGNLTEEQLQALKNPKITQQQKTAFAIQMIGQRNVPGRMLTAVMEGSAKKLSYWTQPAVAAYLSANLVMVAEILRLSGEKVAPETRVDLPDLLTTK